MSDDTAWLESKIDPAGTTMVHGRIESTTNVTIQGGILGGTGTLMGPVLGAAILGVEVVGQTTVSAGHVPILLVEDPPNPIERG